MCILTRGWYSDGSRPVEIEMGQLVSKPLHLVSPQTRGVPHYVVVCWGHSSLADTLGDEEEVEPTK